MSDQVRLWVLVIIPLFIVGVSILTWAYLIVKQTPEVFRRDRFNLSLFGTIVPLGIYLIGRALTRAGANTYFDTQTVLMVSAAFALWGWPSIIARLKELKAQDENRAKG